VSFLRQAAPHCSSSLDAHRQTRTAPAAITYTRTATITPTPPDVLQVDVKQLLQPRPLHLDDHRLAALQLGQVHLPQAGRRDGDGVELGEYHVRGRAQVGLEDGEGGLRVKRRDVVLLLLLLGGEEVCVFGRQ
jgi:hypothetical protein